MTITRLLVALLAIFAMAPTVGAQDPVRNLRDVVGMNLGNGWREMDQRGYTRVRTDGEYTYFRESRSNRCVIMHADRGRVASVVYTDDFDCDRGSSNSSSYGGGGGDVRELRDLQGTRGSDGEYQMKQRGYRLDHVDKSTSGISQYWSKGRDCVQVEMYDGDDELAALDVKLTSVYKKALESFPAEEVPTLKAMQRGWIKGRDESWKADDPKAYVKDAYQRRIVELQIKTGSVMVPPQRSWSCSGADFDYLASYFYDTDPKSATLTTMPNGDQVIAIITPAASGSRYQTSGVDFWVKGEEAKLEWYGASLTCELRPGGGAE